MKEGNTHRVTTPFDIHLDFFDRLRILFGNKISIKQTVYTNGEFSQAQSSSVININSKSFVNECKSLPDIGLIEDKPKEDEQCDRSAEG
jgi:hypothetical protein